jgi:hypothetical protein
VSLIADDGKPLQKITTGNNGQFTFAEVLAGKYTLKVFLFELPDVDGRLQIVVVKRGSHSFPVRLPDSQLAGVFVPTRDHLPHLADNRPRALRG